MSLLFLFFILTFLIVLYFAVGYWKYQTNISKVKHIPTIQLPQFWDLVDPLVVSGLIPPSWVRFRFHSIYNDKFSYFEKFKTPVLVVPTRLYPDVIVADPEIVKQVTITQRLDFPKPPVRFTIFGPSLVSSEGEVWRRHRKVSAPTFSEKNYRLVSEATIRIVTDMFHFWESKKNSHQETRQEVHKDMLQIALSVLSHAAFGRPLSWEDSMQQNNFCPKKGGKYHYTFQKALDLLLKHLLYGIACPKWLLPLIPFGPLKEYGMALKDFSGQLKDMVEERMEILKSQGLTSDMDPSTFHIKQSDLFTNLLLALQSSETNTTKNNYLKLDEFYGNLFIFILAGHETTAGTLTFALILLATHPEIQDKLYQEITKVIGKDRLPTYDDYPQLLYPQYIMKETLRLFPVATMVSKFSNKDVTLQIPFAKYSKLQTGSSEPATTTEETMVPIVIPKHTQVRLNIAAIHRNPFYWPRPNEFIPERFDPLHAPFSKTECGIGVDKKVESSALEGEERGSEGASDLPYHRQAFIPFSEGTRSCIGRKFSEVEFAFALTLISQYYTIRLPDQLTKEQVLQTSLHLTLRPKLPVELIFTRREGVTLPEKLD